MNMKKRSFSLVTATVAAALALTTAAPMAFADNNTASNGAVAVSRSFPKVNTAKANLFAEATSTTVNGDSNWGGIESLNVPQTQSTAEKEAEAAAQAKAEAEARAQAQEEAAAAASRSHAREDTAATADTAANTGASAGTAAAAAPVAPQSGNGAALAAFAQGYVGTPYVMGGNTPSPGWDCSGFVQWVFSQFGISLPRTSGEQAMVGTAVPSLAQAQPGDIIANGAHAAIYIGNGMVVNALNPSDGTQITAVAATSTLQGGYSIRRVL
ncbi:C40 family peptidase [Bifidobacterium magnum]|nr:C40 family peptidase [Bifidobacterium magnum]